MKVPASVRQAFDTSKFREDVSRIFGDLRLNSLRLFQNA
jgi:hypothetical protein